MKLDQTALGKCCPKCRQVITEDVINTVELARLEAYTKAFANRKAKGFKRSPNVDDNVVRYYFDRGTSKLNLAKRLGVDLTTIYRSLKRTEEKTT